MNDVMFSDVTRDARIGNTSPSGMLIGRKALGT